MVFDLDQKKRKEKKSLILSRKNGKNVIMFITLRHCVFLMLIHILEIVIMKQSPLSYNKSFD